MKNAANKVNYFGIITIFIVYLLEINYGNNVVKFLFFKHKYNSIRILISKVYYPIKFQKLKLTNLYMSEIINT